MDIGKYFILITLSPVIIGLPFNNESQILIDQRQTGKYNIHLSIKDVAIIELGGNDFQDDNSNDSDDYYYDDSALTIKPWLMISSTKPTSTTTKSPNTTTAIIYVTPVKENVTESENSNSTQLATSPSSTIHFQDPTTQTTNLTSMIPSTTISTQSTITTTSTVQSNKVSSLPPSTDKPEYINRPQDIPVKIIMEPLLIPRFRASQRNPFDYFIRRRNQDSRVYRLKPNMKNFLKTNGRNFQQYCAVGQIMDANGICRKKRSNTTLFEKIFGLLKAIPFKDDKDT